VRVLVAATAKVAIPTLEWLKQSEHELIGIVTTPDSRTGRGKILSQSSVAKWAEDNQIVALKPNTHDEMRKAFENTDVVIAIAYGRILQKDILALPKYGFLNLHFSLLPSYRGAAPVQRALLNGEKKTGISIFKIDESLDTGPIYLQKSYEIPVNATSEDVLKDLSEIGAQSFHKVLIDIENGDQPKAQTTENVTFAPKITKEEARIDWAKPAQFIHNLVRAFTPSPGAWTTMNENIIKVSQVIPTTKPITLTPGTIEVQDRRLFATTSDFCLEIVRIIPAGKKEMLVSDWLNGTRVSTGDKFE